VEWEGGGTPRRGGAEKACPQTGKRSQKSFAIGESRTSREKKKAQGSPEDTVAVCWVEGRK